MPEMSIEQLARITANARAGERVKLAAQLTDHADVLRAAGEFSAGDFLDAIASELRGPVARVASSSVAPSSPFGAGVAEIERVSASGPADEPGDGLPAMQFNSDEDDAMRVLRAQSPVMARQSAMRD